MINLLVVDGGLRWRNSQQWAAAEHDDDAFRSYLQLLKAKPKCCSRARQVKFVWLQGERRGVWWE